MDFMVNLSYLYHNSMGINHYEYTATYYRILQFTTFLNEGHSEMKAHLKDVCSLYSIATHTVFTTT